MKEISFEIKLENIEQAADRLLAEAKGHKQFAFYGGMGAGKTTFITALCSRLDALDLVSSPTFSIVNEYETKSGTSIFHFDFYRIEKPEELFDIGFEEYNTSDSWCFIEWPEKGEGLIPDTFLKLTIEVDSFGKRILKLNL